MLQVMVMQASCEAYSIYFSCAKLHFYSMELLFYRAQISGQVRVQVQVGASPGPGFLVVLLCTVHIYWFFKSLKNNLKPMQTYTQINC
jgi:hypothetical protein